MLYLLAIALGICVGFAAGGKISNISDFKLEKTYLIIAAFVIQTAAQIISVKGIAFISDNSLLIYGIVFILMLLGFWYNRHYFGVLIIGVGCVLNAIVMMLNDGKMPVSYEAINKAGMSHMVEALRAGADGKHILLTESTRLPLLADIMHPPYFLSILMQVVSVGDLLVVLGLGILVFEMIIGKRINWRYSNDKAN